MPPYPHTQVTFEAADGYPLQGAFYLAEGSNRYLLIGSAFGVPYQYYKHFADYMARNGFNTLVFDYRGISHSKQGNMPTDKILMQHWGQRDIEAAIQFILAQDPVAELHYLGHSAGGQILGLAQSSPKINKIIIAASGVGTWRKWPGLQKYLLAGIWYLVFPLVKLFQKGDYFHSKMLGPIPVPKHAVNQWLNWARSKDYLFTPQHELDLSAYQAIKANIFAVTISDDWYAPVSARDALLSHYASGQTNTLLVQPKDINLKSIGHFGLFKKKQEIEQGIWQPMLNFLTGKSDD
ncbi:alpha/beta fold hydrolase [Kangiella sp. TOML190]|uniref:alpha/beta hydrolase family protein n=1 Tax=Kangiella sp. TOML190 TaxID=2931351 RepID=UPI00203B0F90|nr:alpha/beta fold hydrolase [Kangiella sp. TOML190]